MFLETNVPLYDKEEEELQHIVKYEEISPNPGNMKKDGLEKHTMQVSVSVIEAIVYNKKYETINRRNINIKKYESCNRRQDHASYGKNTKMTRKERDSSFLYTTIYNFR